ncbi:dihydrofolate reductase family protein [Actinomadura rupiterrae]|uniref:dihydrofolate reductase family protein n=1 Tax=Actinomadura rupiterrae TaxID=559627 RepID=UPI0020A3275B|nr:dihydrofolate reductase family protein [Actinomadura rupiterrae]MCP2343521.1 dihydrofolate reductase [Actinomadura rupiterrae]
MTETTGRRVTANLSLTMDGRYHGPGGPADLSAIVPYAVTDLGRDHLARLHEHATTAVLGRGSAQGFMSYWPPVADDPDADPRDRGYASWLVGVEKVVLSTTLVEAPWERTRIVDAPAAEVVEELKALGDGDILVNSSPSIIRPLLAADLVDRLYLLVVPEIAGVGARLFDDGLPATKWTLTRQEAGRLGELSLTYDRAR